MDAPAPQFPPLFDGVPAPAGALPFAAAIAMAREGCDAGTVVYRIDADRLRAAVAFAPEVPLEEAVTMLVVAGVGFSNALGALSPPEVAVHLEWNGTLRLNGAVCGRVHMAAAPAEPGAVPDWLVVGLEVDLIPQDPDTPGLTPDRTSLFDEGCGEIEPVHLLEAWVRHMLTWIHRWEEDGPRALHEEWRGMAHGMGEEIADPVEPAARGLFTGVDERFGLLIKDGETTRLIPLTALLEEGERA